MQRRVPLSHMRGGWAGARTKDKLKGKHKSKKKTKNKEKPQWFFHQKTPPIYTLCFAIFRIKQFCFMLQQNNSSCLSLCFSQRDSVVFMPTGAGKSMCFWIPPLVAQEDSSHFQSVVIISPLLALMNQQAKDLEDFSLTLKSSPPRQGRKLSRE